MIYKIKLFVYEKRNMFQSSIYALKIFISSNMGLIFNLISKFFLI